MLFLQSRVEGSSVVLCILCSASNLSSTFFDWIKFLSRFMFPLKIIFTFVYLKCMYYIHCMTSVRGNRSPPGNFEAPLCNNAF